MTRILQYIFRLKFNRSKSLEFQKTVLQLFPIYGRDQQWWWSNGCWIVVPTGQSNVRWRVNPRADRTSQHKTANCANRIDGEWFGGWRNTQFTWHIGKIKLKIGHNYWNFSDSDNSKFILIKNLWPNSTQIIPLSMAPQKREHQVPCSVGQQSSPAITNANRKKNPC